MSRFQVFSDAQWLLIEGLLPRRTGRRGRPFSDARMIVEGIVCRYRFGIAWRDVPEAFGPWQTLWTWHRRMASEGTWDRVLERLLASAEAAGLIDRLVGIGGLDDCPCAPARNQCLLPHRGLGRITRIRVSSRLTMPLAALAAG